MFLFRCHADLPYQKAIEESEKLDEEIQEVLKKLLQEKSKAARCNLLNQNICLLLYSGRISHCV